MIDGQAEIDDIDLMRCVRSCLQSFLCVCHEGMRRDHQRAVLDFRGPASLRNVDQHKLLVALLRVWPDGSLLKQSSDVTFTGDSTTTKCKEYQNQLRESAHLLVNVVR